MIIRSDNYISRPVVACGIIVYNQKQWIKQCLDGMLAQECDFPYNIVVADDCSTDGTQDVLREYQAQYPDKIKLVLNEQNGHIAKNWVSCARALEGGEYVAFCDGDDYWSNPKKLQLQVGYMRAHTDCVAVSTDVDNIDEQGHIIKRNVYQHNPPLTGMVQYDMWTGGKSIATWSSYLFHRTAFDKIPLQGFIDHDFPFQDWPATVIMAAYGEFHFLPISTVAYRVVEGSDSNGVNIQKIARRQIRTFQMNQYLASLFPETLPMDDEETYFRYLAGTLVASCILCNEYKQAKMYARKNHNWKSLRNWCCQTWITFQLWRMAKIMRRGINKLKIRN